jgi:hypothetical protein
MFDRRGEPTVLLLGFLSLVALNAPGAAFGQPGSQTESKPEESIVWSEIEPPIITEPRALPSEAPRLDLSELQQAQLNVETSRLWLALTSGAFGLGWVMTFAGFARCETVNDELICPKASDRTATAGVLFLSFGSIGVVVSSIMLGVRNGKKRALVHRTVQALGWIFTGVAIPRCARSNGSLSCTNAGAVHMTIGLASTSAGAAGMLISGILLGVRNAKKRDLKTKLPWHRNARLRWDPRSSAFVF